MKEGEKIGAWHKQLLSCLHANMNKIHHDTNFPPVISTSYSANGNFLDNA